MHTLCLWRLAGAFFLYCDVTFRTPHKSWRDTEYFRANCIFSTCYQSSFISSLCIVTSSPSSILTIFSTLHSLLLRWMIQRCFSLLHTPLPNHQSERQRAVRSQSGYAMTAVVACSYRTCGTARRCFSVTHTQPPTRDLVRHKLVGVGEQLDLIKQTVYREFQVFVVDKLVSI
jgi:hypothetical protein